MSRRQTLGRWLSTSDAALSWGERIMKWLVIGLGSSTITGLAGTVIGFWANNLLYGLVIGVVLGMLLLGAFALKAISIAAAGAPVAPVSTPEGAKDEVDSGNAATAQTDSAQDAARLRTQLAEVEKRLDSADAVIQRQQEQLSEWDGERQRFKHFLLEAWSEGTNLRGGNPSKEEAREWEGHVWHLLEQARGEEFADKALRHDPNFQSADFDASDAQKFLEMRLQRVDQLSKNVTKSRAIHFRSGFDPYEWKDWKSPPSTGPAATESHQIPEHMISERHIRYHPMPIPLVDLFEAVGDNGVIRDFTFEHCILEGPGIINLEGPFPQPETAKSGSSLSVGPADCRVEGSPDTTLYQIEPSGKVHEGIIHLSGYTLRAVTFRGLGFAGTPEHLAKLKEQFTFSEGNRSPSADFEKEERRRSIDHWRSVIRDFNFETERFAVTDTYSQMKQYLRPEVIEMLEAQRTVHIGNEARGDTAYRYTLLDEVARIEKE
jgi:hypothetical protein